MTPGEARKAKLKTAAQDFEALFIHHLLKRMRATVPKSGESGLGMETMREITDEQLAEYLSRHGGIGLADMLTASLEREESAADHSASGSPANTNLSENRMIKLNAVQQARQLPGPEEVFRPVRR